MLDKINWYYNRVKTFSVEEVLFRLSQKKQAIQEQFFLHTIKPPKEYSHSEKILRDILIDKADTNFHIFKWKLKPEEITNWQQDISTKGEFPLIFSKSINTRITHEASAKIVWEVNRLQFLTSYCINYKHTNEEKYLSSFISILSSWIDTNPYLKGVNWYSNIEVNIRLIVWFLCWEILDANELIKQNQQFSDFVKLKWIPSIYEHCVYSYNNPSKYSSSNNHLISEYAGLFVATSLWNFSESKKWNEYAKNGLEVEIRRQHSKDGINKEEAAEYIQFITDFFLISHVVAERTDNGFSDGYKEVLKNIFYYIYNFIDINGNFPQYGDEDDGKCFILDFTDKFNNFKSLLASGAIIFNDPTLKSKANDLDKKNQILFGAKGKEIFDNLEVLEVKTASRFYTEEGHFILRKQEKAEEIYINFDAAPLGFLSIAAHGHADALSFIIHIDGQPIFCDSGTYTYHTEPNWRKYFLGTLSHNTIRINKLNQAKIAGPTMWLEHFSTKIKKTESNAEYDLVVAEHDGYSKIGIIHTREIKFDKVKSIITIKDFIESNSREEYLIEYPLHFHPSVENIINDSKHYSLYTKNKKLVTISIDPKLELNLVRGQVEPFELGWYSKSFMEKEPCSTILGTLKCTGNISLETHITIRKA